MAGATVTEFAGAAIGIAFAALTEVDAEAALALLTGTAIFIAGATIAKVDAHAAFALLTGATVARVNALDAEGIGGITRVVANRGARRAVPIIAALSARAALSRTAQLAGRTTALDDLARAPDTGRDRARIRLHAVAIVAACAVRNTAARRCAEILPRGAIATMAVSSLWIDVVTRQTSTTVVALAWVDLADLTGGTALLRADALRSQC
jgi:hypothetical protein